MPLSRHRARGLLLCVPLLAACGGGDPVLEGSLGELLSLRYEKAVLELGEAEVSVRFVRARGAGEDTVLEVAANLGLPAEAGGGALLATGPVDLTEEAPDGQQRGVVRRNVLDDPRQGFPTLARGSLQLSQVPEPGGTTRGSFHVTFDQGTDFGCGRTVFADFEASLP